MSFPFHDIRLGSWCLNATFNKISVISSWSDSMVEETTDLSQVTDKLLSHNVVSSTPHHEWGSNSQV